MPVAVPPVPEGVGVVAVLPPLPDVEVDEDPEVLAEEELVPDEELMPDDPPLLPEEEAPPALPAVWAKPAAADTASR